MRASDGSLLLDLLRGQRPSDFSPERIDSLYDLAVAHGLAGLVHEALETRGAILPRWKAYAEQTELGAKVQLQSAAEAAAALRAADVEAVFVKGAALALSVYPRALRPFNDLDVLILPEHLRAAHRALSGLGYHANNAGANPIELDYVREKLPGFRVCIDLHWDFTAEDGLQAGVRMPLREILSRRNFARDVPIPSHEDALLLAAANLARKCAEPVMLIVDFARLLQIQQDWERVGEHATRWGLKTPLWIGVTLAGQLLGAAVPADFCARLAPPPWRARRLLTMLDAESLWHTDKQKLLRYHLLFKLLCADSWRGMGAIAIALPSGVLRKLGLTRNLAAAVLRENPAPSTSSNPA